MKSLYSCVCTSMASKTFTSSKTRNRETDLVSYRIRLKSCIQNSWDPRVSSKQGWLNDPCSSSKSPMRRGKSAKALSTGEGPVGGEGGGTRLGRIVSGGGKLLLEKLNAARKNFPMKVFLLLLGFYTANALATILGQTGDWDVLVAGVVVAALEGIGMVMYRKPSGRFQPFVAMLNYWKTGVCLGLFVDAFKLGS